MNEKPAKKQSAEPLEKQLFKSADKLRKNIDAAEYKNVVLGLVFLKYISDTFEELYAKLSSGEGEHAGANPEDIDEYRAQNVFFVPKEVRWSYLHGRAKLPTIGEDLDSAMESIEKLNPSLKGILPRVYARPNLDKASLGGLIDLIGNIALGDEASRAKDLLGRVYEYFLGEFANAEGKKGGQFYTPKSIVKLMVEMIEPYKGRIYDPCCGSGGMFIMSEKFIKAHSGRIDDIAVYGQESNQTTYRLARMNLAIRGIDATGVKWNTEGSFLKDAHPDLKADFILANPPFNVSDWSGELLQNDPRWQYGKPPAGNANFAWIQHMLYHLSPNGIMATVLANGSLSSQSSGEGDIRKALVDANLVDCIVMLPKQMFFNTGIPACIWFLSRKRIGNTDRKKKDEVLFIDASNVGYMADRTHKEFSDGSIDSTDNDITMIAQVYHNWRTGEGNYEDVKGFTKSATIADIQKHNYVLTPGRYVEIKDAIDDGIPFEEKMAKLTGELKLQMAEEVRLNEEIKKQLAKVGIEL
jgi:type I restriction enzyme M protein